MSSGCKYRSVECYVWETRHGIESRFGTTHSIGHLLRLLEQMGARDYVREIRPLPGTGGPAGYEYFVLWATTITKPRVVATISSIQDSREAASGKG